MLHRLPAHFNPEARRVDEHQWKVVTAHTARHTGADMLLGSGGNENLQEKVLGHAAVYGHDDLERYGPALLEA